MLKTIAYFITTIILTTILISIVSSQLVLADIQRFGLEVSFVERISVTFKDIIGLSPILLLMVGLSFLFAFIIAKMASKILGGNKKLWNIAAGFSSFPVTLYILSYLMGLMLLASARNFLGMFLIACCSGLGGWLFNYFTELIKGDIQDD